MLYIATIRFTNKTIEENVYYKRDTCTPGVLYGVSIKIREKYPLQSFMFVLEMNNSTNQLNGIGLIRNSLIVDKAYNIYDDDNYNRFIYKGDLWISRETILEYDLDTLCLIENILFKGKSHLKRQGGGISVIGNKLYGKWNTEEKIIKRKIKNMFVHFCKNKNEF